VNADEQAVLNFGVVGRVGNVSVDAGDRVKMNQVLATLENADFKVAAQAAQAELKRVRDLSKEGLLSQAALDEARRAAEVAQATYQKSIIVAPFDGLVTEVNLRKGEIAQIPAGPDKPPVRLIDVKTRLIKGEIDELDLGKVKPGLAARVKIPALENKKFTAKVTKTVPFVSSTREQDRTSQIELRFDQNDPSIPVGASAEIEIVIDEKPNVLVLPARAVLGTSRQRYVYQISDGRLSRKNVEIGLGNYDRREIIKGLKAGDVVALPSEDYEMSEGDRVNAELQPWP
jgi:HlyD family secretion protein